MTEPNKRDARKISARHRPLQKGSFGCCAVEKHVSITFITTLIRFVTTSSVYEINIDMKSRKPKAVGCNALSAVRVLLWVQWF